MLDVSTKLPSYVLIGHESSGKSSIFRFLTNSSAVGEGNFRGSTVNVKAGMLEDHSAYLLDTPGIRVKSDSVTTRRAMEKADDADTIVLVVRGTHVRPELTSLLQELGPALRDRRATIVVTFADLAPKSIRIALQKVEKSLAVPIVLVNSKIMSEADIRRTTDAIRNAGNLSADLKALDVLRETRIVQPATTLFEYPYIGKWVSVFILLMLYAVPIWAAYKLADYVQPIADDAIITPIVSIFEPLSTSLPMLYSILVGDYGVITLGWYSFLWAFPVVVFIGLSVAISEEAGLKDRITSSLDPWLRVIGLSGRDLVPVLTGFGCNVVAVFQSRSCNQCNRKACVSMISFASACSYQIGASLSVFNAAQVPWLALPYIAVLVVFGAIHNRFWHGGFSSSDAVSINDRAFIQAPSLAGVRWKSWLVVKQFLIKAMPIFLVICAVSAGLEYVGVMDQFIVWFAPFLSIFALPADVAPGIVFSMIRKDGLLVLNQDNGQLLATLSNYQLFLTVYIASTLTSCMVTLLAIGRELGIGPASKLAGRQAISSVVSAFILVAVLSGVF